MLTVKVFMKGGVVAPSDLRKIAQAAFSLRTHHFQFGERQEIIFEIPDQKELLLAELFADFNYEVGTQGNFINKNMVSSLLSTQIAPSTYWVKDSTYFEILDTFDKPMKIRVNVSDLQQDLVYSFTGDINFVPSDQANYWHFYLHIPDQEEQYCAPFLAHSENLEQVAKLYEKLFFQQGLSTADIVETFRSEMGAKLIEDDLNPKISVSEFFNYEGLHAYGDDKYWLGIYKRFAKFNFPELYALCELCQQHRIGKIYITPWKSLLVKGIAHENVVDWKHYLSQYNISIGHAQSELNWQIQDFDEGAQLIKKMIRKDFVRNDLNTSSIIIGINTDHAKSFSHLLIQLRRNWPIKVFDIFYRKDFNPISREFVQVASKVPYWKILKHILNITLQYNEVAFQQNAAFKTKEVKVDEKKEADKELEEVFVHQCQDCFTVYDPKIGDPEQGYKPGTPFAFLPDDYECPLCGAEKKSFHSISLEKLSIA